VQRNLVRTMEKQIALDLVSALGRPIQPDWSGSRQGWDAVVAQYLASSGGLLRDSITPGLKWIQILCRRSRPGGSER
jgi:hypothetical protein